VVSALEAYHADSGRYPLAVRALVPGYLPATPNLACISGPAPRYYLATCETGIALMMGDLHHPVRWQFPLEGSRSSWSEISFMEIVYGDGCKRLDL